MNDTPRTDAKEKESQKCDAKKHAYYGWKHARKLELELADARKEFDMELAEELRDPCGTIWECYDKKSKEHRKQEIELATLNKTVELLTKENTELRKDKERLYWLDNALNNGAYFGDADLLEFLICKSTGDGMGLGQTLREAIDDAMGDKQ